MHRPHEFGRSHQDLATILRCRGDSNRLGYGVMLCYLNYPGRALQLHVSAPGAYY
ncbi:MAG: DUF4158 domain-containing protein [Roseiarcus sp.]